MSETPAEESLPDPVVPLTYPADGIPPLTADDAALAQLASSIGNGTGPVAVDAERASGYRYGQRAYLIQLRRAGAGTSLIDPIPISDFAPLAEVLAEPEWVLHAASQDLPCLAELGLRPSRLFDTELAARLLGRPRVGLGPLVEDVLGLSLAKEHSAADWSTRPLPEPWLTYAALDVEVLLDLRSALALELEVAGKADWAAQEFAAIAAAPPAQPRVDPWRRTSGLHRIRNRRALAVVRAIWLARDRVAQERDTSPGRVLPDSAIVAAAAALPTSRNALAGLSEFGGRGAQRRLTVWWQAIESALALPDGDLPPHALASDAPPPPRSWPDRDPAAAARLSAARAALAEIAGLNSLPVENLIAPDVVRRICWEPPVPATTENIVARLQTLGARPWQIGLSIAAIASAMDATADAAADPAAPEDELTTDASAS